VVRVAVSRSVALAFFVDAEHQGVLGRVQVQASDVAACWRIR